MSRLALLWAVLAAIAMTESTNSAAPAWRVRGDTTGAPHGCSAAAAISAMDSFVAALQTADSVGLERATARRNRNGFVYSTGKFTPADSFVSAHSVRDLVRYARIRARRHERIVVQEVTFNGWRGRGLEFGPIYFLRSADDLGPGSHPGIGKGEYLCGDGFTAFNTAPRPSFDRGPRP